MVNKVNLSELRIDGNILSGLLKKIIASFIENEARGMDTHEYLLNIDSIFLDSNIEEMILVFLPKHIDSNERLTHKSFLKEILNSIQYDLDSELSYYVKINNYLNGSEFDLYEFRKLIELTKEYEDIKSHEIEEVIEKPVAINISTNNVNLKNNNYYSDKYEKVAPSTEIVIEHKSLDESTTEYDEDDDCGTTVLGMDDDDIERVYLDRKSTGEKIDLDKERLKIGRDSSACDYVVQNKSVGRIHATILSDSSGYYIMDNNSTNGTYLNGEKITSVKKYKLQYGDEIKLANEVFNFRLY